MKIFLSGLSIDLLAMIHSIDRDRKPNVLLTFYDLRNPRLFTKTHRDKINSLILDCGAYSLYSKGLRGKQFELATEKLYKGFKTYAVAAQNEYDFIFSMDDRFDPDGFDHNLERLEDLEAAGLEAVPVIHKLGEKERSYFIRKGYKIVAIGQCKADKRNDLNILYPEVEELYCNNIKVHLFGMTSPSSIAHVPAYSCDSKSWLIYAKSGIALYWNPNSNNLDKTDRIYFPKYQEISKSPPGIHYIDYSHYDGFLEHISNQLNFKESDLLGVDKEICMQLVNTFYFMDLEQRITEEQKELHIKFD